MKSIRNWKLVKHLGLAALALCSFAVLVNAQAAYQGKFTLPVEARWGGSVLPAGDYTFTLPSTAAPYVLYVRGEGKAAIIVAAAAETKVVSDRPQLNLVNTGDGYAVRTLESARPRLDLRLRGPRGQNRRPPLFGDKPVFPPGCSWRRVRGDSLHLVSGVVL